MRPRTSRLPLAVCIVAAVLAAPLISLPVAGIETVELLVAAFAWLAAVIVWLVAVGVSLQERRWSLALLWSPLILAVIVMLAVSGVPKAVRVWVSEGQLDVYLASAASTEPPAFIDEYAAPEWIGLEPVYGFERHGSDIYIVTGFVGSDTPGGLVRLANGPPPGSLFLFGRLYSDWYVWSRF